MKEVQISDKFKFDVSLLVSDASAFLFSRKNLNSECVGDFRFSVLLQEEKTSKPILLQ